MGFCLLGNIKVSNHLVLAAVPSHVTLLVTVVASDVLLVTWLSVRLKLWFPGSFVKVVEVHGFIAIGCVCTWDTGRIASLTSLVGARTSKGLSRSIVRSPGSAYSLIE